MKLKQQICSLKLAKKLKKLGVKQESFWYWVDINTTGKFVIDNINFLDKRTKKDGLLKGYCYSAFSFSELVEKVLPSRLKDLNNLEISFVKTDPVTGKLSRSKWWNISYEGWENAYTSKHNDIYLRRKSYHLKQARNGANALAEMYIYLIKNNLIKKI